MTLEMLTGQVVKLGNEIQQLRLAIGDPHPTVCGIVHVQACLGASNVARRQPPFMTPQRMRKQRATAAGMNGIGQEGRIDRLTRDG